MIIYSIPVRSINYKYKHPKFCDLIELRLDYLENPTHYQLCHLNQKTILTIRDFNEGGIKFCQLENKISYYKKAISSTNCLVDLEINNFTNEIPAKNLIISYHNFKEIFDPKELEKIIIDSNKLSAKYLKIAVNITSYYQFLILEYLIKLSNKPVILVGMDKLGKLSRLLYKHLGSVATYIAEAKNKTANGQLTIEEAKRFYLDKLSSKTLIGGLIGGKQVYHSLGLSFYNNYFVKHKLDSVYFPFEVDDFDDFWFWINNSKIIFYGFSITMPHKSEISKHLRISSKFQVHNLYIPSQEKILNTDMLAFGSAFDYLKINKTDKIMIVGTGNTAETALFALQDFHNVIICGRNSYSGAFLAKKYSRKFYHLTDKIEQIDLLINCTSIGLENEDFWIETKLNKEDQTFSNIKVIDLPYAKKISSLITHCHKKAFKYADGGMFWKWQAERQLIEFCQAINAKEKKIMQYNPVELIIKKREGKELTRDEIRFFIGNYLEGNIPEYQMSSLLMAIFFAEMNPKEIQTLTEIYIESGARITFDKSLKTVDKHSTGGVGDKITIPLAPIVAACGAKIPMISGRGLGHTGGTLDKLESIPGFRTDFPEDKFREFIEKDNFSIISQSEALVPADKNIYALRDVTGTVESLPLITASIMSKKIAEGAQNLVIDLKVGSGAFIKTMENAERLGKLLATTGKNLGQNVTVVFSDMNSPLGNYIGNALEVKESIEYLQGKRVKDIHHLTKTLAIEMLLLSDICSDKITAGKMVEQVIDDGSALEYFRRFIINQGGDPRVCDDVTLLPQAKYTIPIIATQTGWIEKIDSQSIGFALIGVGAGRKTLDSKLDYSSGAFLPIKIGTKINAGEEIGKIFCNDKEAGKEVVNKILNSIHFSKNEIPEKQLIIKIVDKWD